MSPYPRYAIYYVPARGSKLDRFGADLLGYDVHSGHDVPFPDSVSEALPDWRDLTQDPRKYGFHATLKAPLALAPGRTEAELVAACEAFAATPRPAAVINPVVDFLSGFIAVVPAQTSSALQALALDCVREFDGFRAALTAEDRARRNPATLTASQLDHLDRFGYPYVANDFRFHMTLTGRLDRARRVPVLTVLRECFSGIGLQTLTIDRLALCRQQDPDSRFRVIDHWQLRAT